MSLRLRMRYQILKYLHQRHFILKRHKVTISRRNQMAPAMPVTTRTTPFAAQTQQAFDDMASWEHRIRFPIDMDTSVRYGKPIPMVTQNFIASSSVSGQRLYNEDRTLCTQISPRMLLFGIFDGHGGSVAVDLAYRNLASHVKLALKITDDIAQALRLAFISVDKLIESNNPTGEKSGSTATVCILQDSKYLHIAHVGDSRAFLCRSGNIIRLTEDHVPEDDKERERVEQIGGQIIWNSRGKALVDGRLSMTRSLGDIHLKESGVTAEPLLRSFRVKHSRDAFCLLITDGISFVMKNEEIVRLINSARTPRDAAKLITDQAMQFGAEDNCSSLVVPFGAWARYYMSLKQSPKFTFGRTVSSSMRFL